MASDPATSPSSAFDVPAGHATGSAAPPANRLADATSPYLLQHAHNPVNWYPWGLEALMLAKQENKPIFLSIGYSACHWCHVMEREVFENPDIAALMNAHFINIKVDREERPDLDELYMLATQIATGSGGWPMSVWLTPELEPFYAGTYFPPADAYGRPGFPRLCRALADAWSNRPGELRAQAARVVEAVRQSINDTTPLAAVNQLSSADTHRWIQGAIEQFADRFDDEYGGLGSSPKFPPSQALHLWLELLRPQHTFVTPQSLSLVRAMLTTTLDQMMRGGIYDQIGGGFARYSTDPYWLVPHFEKMLYDNAQLAPAYALAAVQLGRPDYTRIARGTLDFWLREMSSDQGALYSTLDADSEGQEGRYYVWTLADVRAAIPNADDANLIIKHFGITAEGNWEEGGAGVNILHAARTAEVLAREYGSSTDAMQKRLDAISLQLRKIRKQRVPPQLDDKILTGWNGLMISALALAGRLLREPRYLEAAHRAIGFILLHHMAQGRTLLRASRAGKAAVTPAFLEDHAYLLNGLMDLIDSTAPTSLPGTMARKRALELADTMVRLFHDPQAGGFFFSGPQHETLFAQIKNATDGAVPSANGLAIRALLRLARSSGKEEYRHIAMQAVAAFAPAIERQPSYFATILHALAEDARLQAETPPLNAPIPPSDMPDAAGQRPIPRGIEASPIPADPNGAILTLEPVRLPPLHSGESFEIPLRLKIAEGYHIQLHTPRDREAFATVTRVRGDLPLASQEWTYPPGEPIELSAAFDAGYRGEIIILGRCAVAPTAAPGRYTLRATVLAQPCSATYCLAPERASVEISIVME